jgi:hypothetical protein
MELGRRPPAPECGSVVSFPVFAFHHIAGATIKANSSGAPPSFGTLLISFIGRKHVHARAPAGYKA